MSFLWALSAKHDTAALKEAKINLFSVVYHVMISSNNTCHSPFLTFAVSLQQSSFLRVGVGADICVSSLHL